MEQTLLRRFTIDKISTGWENISNRLIAGYRRNKLNNIDFTIISNNCWGGSVYRRYGLPYASPTVGMYFFAEEYIRFLSDLEKNIYLPFRIIEAKESKYSKELHRRGQDSFYIGVLGDEIEIVLMHYHNRTEAIEKWNRRVKRVNFDNLIVKMSEMNLCTEKHLRSFCNLSFKKKVLLTAKERGFENEIVIKRYTRNNEISNDTLYYSRHVDLEKLINE